MTTLPQAQRQMLKAKAHQLKPVVMIGGNGLTDAVHAEIARALHDHELIKVKVAGAEREARQTMIDNICTTHDAALVQQVGHIAVVYRARPKKD